MAFDINEAFEKLREKGEALISFGRAYPTVEAGGTRAWADTGTSDVKLTFTTTGATSAGEIRATILYQQNSNLA